MRRCEVSISRTSMRRSRSCCVFSISGHSRHQMDEHSIFWKKKMMRTKRNGTFHHEAIHATLNAWKIDAIATERVFHNKNISSSLTTGAVIGLVHLIGHHHGIRVAEFTPQQVKEASGLGLTINKDTVKVVASRLFGSPIQSHHEADAALCALCVCLQARTVVP